MILGKYFKAPVERKRYLVDYTDWLDAGELLSTVTFEVMPTTTNVLIIDGNTIETGAKGVAFFASNGLDGKTYKTIITATTTNGQIKEDTVQYTIKAA